MSIISERALDAAEQAFWQVVSSQDEGGPRKGLHEAILATLPHMGEPALLDEVRKILDEHSAWIARPNSEVDQAISLAACLSALRVMGAWSADAAPPVDPVKEKMAKALKHLMADMTTNRIGGMAEAAEALAIYEAEFAGNEQPVAPARAE